MNEANIKICGIADAHTLNTLCELNINYVGFIFYDKSIRNVTSDFLLELEAINFESTRPVCVFVNPSEEEVYKAISFFENPILQFHGDETCEFCESFGMDYWKTIHMQSEASLNAIENYSSADAFLLETFKKDAYGGTGESFNWSFVTDELLANTNIILSGGINLKNIDNALIVKPWCLDINSGVESKPGIKDTLLIDTMIKKIRS